MLTLRFTNSVKKKLFETCLNITVQKSCNCSKVRKDIASNKEFKLSKETESKTMSKIIAHSTTKGSTF